MKLANNGIFKLISTAFEQFPMTLLGLSIVYSEGSNMPQVMIVDDSLTLRAVIAAYLKPLNCEVVLVPSGEDALMLVADCIPDLIILDVEMPGLNGFDTCKAIRGFLQDHWIPIIYLTGRSDPADLVQGLNVGGDAYITKPVLQDVLMAITKAMLRVSSAQAELLSANKKLDEVAYFDVLTQITNRRGYEDMLARLWKDHERRLANMSVLLMDIDFFKKYNDNYGHIKGDECLRQVAQTLKEELKRPIDVLARYGGEEFVVLLPDTDINGAKLVGERLIKALEKANILHEFSDAQPFVSISIGAAQTGSAKTTVSLLEAADAALYKAKEAGRNRIICG
jgi:diguanylate cyclase (GGDEF)-like protein